MEVMLSRPTRFPCCVRVQMLPIAVDVLSHLDRLRDTPAMADHRQDEVSFLSAHGILFLNAKQWSRSTAHSYRALCCIVKAAWPAWSPLVDLLETEVLTHRDGSVANQCMRFFVAMYKQFRESEQPLHIEVRHNPRPRPTPSACALPTLMGPTASLTRSFASCAPPSAVLACRLPHARWWTCAYTCAHCRLSTPLRSAPQPSGTSIACSAAAEGAVPMPTAVMVPVRAVRRRSVDRAVR
jgi:hypothetical protein